MPEREAQAHLGHGSKAIHRAYAKKAHVLTLPLEDYEAIKTKKLLVFRGIENVEETDTKAIPIRHG